MSSYTIRYQNPEVSFYSVNTFNTGNSGGAQTIVGNIMFTWNSAEGGFTNTGWWGTSVKNGPTAIGGFSTDDAVIAHLGQPGANLNEAFAAWQTHIDGLSPLEQLNVVTGFANQLAAQENGAGEACIADFN